MSKPATRTWFTVDFKDYGVVCREERVQLLREGKRWVFVRGILG
ncbi:hypothetical protein APHNYW_1620, partial [Anaplasma phagocytophilum str. ApNYW]